MSKQSEKVKRWRKSCKTRIIEAMGGACCVCGYNKCKSSLALHHLNPALKDFGFGKMMASPKKWSVLVEELRKCVLVCNNCHGEIHEGISIVPDNAPHFDESYANYKDLIKETDILTPCPICGKMKADYLKNCSRQCAAKSKFKVDWNSIDIIKELETKTVMQLAEELGCSDSAIHKRMRRLGLK